jgi:hypothetical protein
MRGSSCINGRATCWLPRAGMRKHRVHCAVAGGLEEEALGKAGLAQTMTVHSCRPCRRAESGIRQVMTATERQRQRQELQCAGQSRIREIFEARSLTAGSGARELGSRPQTAPSSAFCAHTACPACLTFMRRNLQSRHVSRLADMPGAAQELASMQAGCWALRPRCDQTNLLAHALLPSWLPRQVGQASGRGDRGEAGLASSRPHHRGAARYAPVDCRDARRRRSPSSRSRPTEAQRQTHHAGKRRKFERCQRTGQLGRNHSQRLHRDRTRLRLRTSSVLSCQRSACTASEPRLTPRVLDLRRI